LGYTEDELGDAVENEAIAATVPVISLCREVGGNTLQVKLLSLVDVVYARSKISRHTLLSFFDLTRKDCINPSVYANKAVLALIVANDGLHNSGVRRDCNDDVAMSTHLYNKCECVLSQTSYRA